MLGIEFVVAWKLIEPTISRPVIFMLAFIRTEKDVEAGFKVLEAEAGIVELYVDEVELEQIVITTLKPAFYDLFKQASGMELYKL
jgi:hypothetical protein